MEIYAVYVLETHLKELKNAHLFCHTILLLILTALLKLIILTKSIRFTTEPKTVNGVIEIINSKLYRLR